MPWSLQGLYALSIQHKDLSITVKTDLKDWDISEELALNMSTWRLAINMPEP